jgi:hypothetical protein
MQESSVEGVSPRQKSIVEAIVYNAHVHALSPYANFSSRPT